MTASRAASFGLRRLPCFKLLPNLADIEEEPRTKGMSRDQKEGPMIKARAFRVAVALASLLALLETSGAPVKLGIGN